MIRKLLCRKCGEASTLHPEDRKMGYQMRKQFLSSQVPAGHGLTINGEFTPLSDLMCDHCGEVITGDIVVATTMWNTNREGEPGNWEAEYGPVLPAHTVAAHDTLSKP